VSDAAQTRRRILESAVRRIAREGIDEVRIARIATDARVSPALVHYHFASREALLVEALEFSYELAAGARTAVAADGTATASRKLGVMVEACLPAPGDQRDDWLLWVELWLRAGRRPELAPAAARLYARLHEWFAQVVQEGIDAGEFRPCDVPAVTDRLLALIDGFGVRVLIGDDAVTLDRAREAVLAAAGEALDRGART
jgi:AcrR family transcriptional regulator